MIKFKKDFNVKIVSLLIAMLFVFNSAVYGIGLCLPKLRAPLMANKATNKEGMKRLLYAIKEGLTYHYYVNEYIALKAQPQYQAYLDKYTLKDNKKNKKKFYNSLPKYPGTDVAIMEIDGLYENTRILEHIGLGQVYGKPIIYIDSSLEPGEKDIVKGHGYYEKTGWAKEKARRRIKEWSEMRDFIIANYDKRRYKNRGDNIHNKANVNYNVDPILKRYEAEYTSDLLNIIANMPFRPKQEDVLIAAGGFIESYTKKFIDGLSELMKQFPGDVVYVFGSAVSGNDLGDVDLLMSFATMNRIASKAQALEKQYYVVVDLQIVEKLLMRDGWTITEIVKFMLTRYAVIRIDSNGPYEYKNQSELLEAITRDFPNLAVSGSPNKVFEHLSDGNPMTKQKIADALSLAVSTIEPDLYFLRDCGLLDIVKEDRENTYAIKSELKGKKILIAAIQKILDREFKDGMIRKNLRIPENRETITAEILSIIIPKIFRKGPITVNDVITRLNVSKTVAKLALKLLVKNRVLIKQGKGNYSWSMSRGSGNLPSEQELITAIRNKNYDFLKQSTPLLLKAMKRALDAKDVDTAHDIYTNKLYSILYILSIKHIKEADNWIRRAEQLHKEMQSQSHKQSTALEMPVNEVIKLLMARFKGKTLTLVYVAEQLNISGASAARGLDKLVEDGILFEKRDEYCWKVSGRSEGLSTTEIIERIQQDLKKILSNGPVYFFISKPNPKQRGEPYRVAVVATDALVNRVAIPLAKSGLFPPGIHFHRPSIEAFLENGTIGGIALFMINTSIDKIVFRITSEGYEEYVDFDKLEQVLNNDYGYLVSGGSVPNVFDKITQYENINDTFTEQRIANLVGRAPATVSHDIRALLTLGLLEPIEEGSKIYKVPEQVKPHIAEIKPHLSIFKGKLLRPNKQELQQFAVYTTGELQKIYGSLKSRSSEDYRPISISIYKLARSLNNGSNLVRKILAELDIDTRRKVESLVKISFSELTLTPVLFIDKDVVKNPSGFKEALRQLRDKKGNIPIVVLTEKLKRHKRTVQSKLIESGIDLKDVRFETRESLVLQDFELNNVMSPILGIDNLRCIPLTDSICNTYKELQKVRD